MKKIIALSAILSLSAAFAEDVDVVYGTFVLNSSEPELILCVPWINPGSTDGSIPVKDLIQTSTLEVDDQLFYYDNGYKAWQVKKVEGKKVWEGVRVVKGEDGGKINANAGDTETLVRGNAIILKRVNMATRENKNIIINGQVGTTPVGAITMASGTQSAPAYTLLAPYSTKETDLNNGATWTGVTKNDCIILPNMTTLVYLKENWGRQKKELKDGKPVIAFDTDAAKIPAGQGAWFVSQSEGTQKVSWEE